MKPVDCVCEEIIRLKAKVEKHDRLYSERHLTHEREVAAALVAVEKQTGLSLAAQRTSADKVEQYQAEYNKTHNDLMRRMDKQAEEYVTRREYLGLVNSISDLRETRSEVVGETTVKVSTANTVKWFIGVLAASVGGLIVYTLQHLIR